MEGICCSAAPLLPSSYGSSNRDGGTQDQHPTPLMDGGIQLTSYNQRARSISLKLNVMKKAKDPGIHLAHNALHLKGIDMILTKSCFLLARQQ